MAVVTMRQLLESGVHFGHQTRRWNPKMKRFIMTERNGIYIIDLQQSVSYINSAYEFVKETVAHGGTILFVGTKKQAQEPIAEQATRVGMPYVNHRWLGGMLTNFQTISKRLTRLKELEELNYDDVAASGYTKKELLIFKRERDKLEKTLGGIRTMAKVPSAVWIVDTKKEHLAVDEAKKLGLPVIAILDTNCDPDEVDYKIPGNDDAIRSVTLLTRVIADAVADGLVSRSGAKTEGDAQTAEGTLFMSRMPPSVRSSFSFSRRRTSSSFLVRPEPATSSKSMPSSSLSRESRLCTVLKLVSMPPSQRWFTYGIPTRVASAWIGSCACFLVPTNRIVPPCATVCLTKSYASLM